MLTDSGISGTDYLGSGDLFKGRGAPLEGKFVIFKYLYTSCSVPSSLMPLSGLDPRREAGGKDSESRSDRSSHGPGYIEQLRQFDRFNSAHNTD